MQVGDKDAGRYFVGTPAEQAEDARGVSAVRRLAQNVAVERDESIRGEHDVIGPNPRDYEAFAKGVPARRLAQRDLGGGHFADFGCDDYVIKACVSQKFSPPGGARSENELQPTRRLHGLVG